MVNLDFINDNSLGFEQLRERVRIIPVRVAAISRLSEQVIVDWPAYGSQSSLYSLGWGYLSAAQRRMAPGPRSLARAGGRHTKQGGGITDRLPRF
jgi:hypothetical protein